MTKAKQEMMKEILNGVGVEIGDEFLQRGGMSVAPVEGWRMENKLDENGLGQMAFFTFSPDFT